MSLDSKPDADVDPPTDPAPLPPAPLPPSPLPPARRTRFGRRALLGGGAALAVGAAAVGAAAVTGVGPFSPQGTPPRSLPPESYGPVGITDFDALQAMVGRTSADLGRIPADVKLVRWPSASPGGASINEVAATLGERDLLVLPEATEPYLVDSSRGFQRFRADAPWGETTEAQLWDEMTRLPVGLVGMGPGTRVETSASPFSRGPQLKSDGGCSNKVIGVSRASGYFGNLVAGGRDYGGVAYHYFAYSPSAGDSSFERLSMLGAHRGFRNSPGGEAGSLMGQGDRLVVRHCEVDCRDAGGKRVGSSPFMTAGGRDHLVEDCYFHHAIAGMPVWYDVTNATATRVRSEFNGSGSSGGVAAYDPVQGWGYGGSAWNLEKCRGRFTWTDCTLICNYQNNYDANQPVSFGQGNVGGHIGGGSDTDSCVLNVVRPRIDWGSDGPTNWDGQRFDLQFQDTYDGRRQAQRSEDIQISDAWVIPAKQPASTPFKLRA